MSQLIVEDVSIQARGKFNSEGTTIMFSSDETISLSNHIGIEFEGEEHYFKVSQIDIRNGNKLFVQAIEVGYYARNFNRKNNFDIRNLLNLDITIITDEKKIAKIREETGWC